MTRTRLTAAAVVLPLLVASACTSSSGGKHPTTNSSSGVTGAALEARLKTSLSSLTSAAISVDTGALGTNLAGHVKLDDGAATASDIVIGSGKDATTIISVGDTSYAKLPAGQNTSGKTYSVVSPSSTNEFTRALVPAAQIVEAASSLGGLADLLGTGTAVTDKGSGHYSFSVTGTKGSGSKLQQLLGQYSTAAVPVDLYLDSSGRPVTVAFALSIAGAAITITVKLSDFNAPVTITAPAANEVLGG